MLMDAALRSKVGGSKSGAYEQVEQPYFYHYCCTGMNHSKVKEEKVTPPPQFRQTHFQVKHILQRLEVTATPKQQLK